MPSRPALLRPPVARLVLTLLTVAVVLFVLLLLYAAPRRVPWTPAAAIELPAAQLRVESGAGEIDGDALRLHGRAADGSARIVADVTAAAGDYRFLSYRFEDFAPHSRLLFAWRGGADSKRWQWAPLPFPRGEAVVDLQRLLPEWSGDLVAVGFIVLPAELLPAHAVPAGELRFLHARLVSDARAPALAALLDEWTAYRPWSGRSINTGGFGLRQADPRPLSAFALLAGLAVLLLAGFLLGWGRRQWLRGAVAVACATWLLLDLMQLRTLAQRSMHTAALARLAPGGLTLEPALAPVLAAVRAVPELAQAPPAAARRKLLVLGTNSFLRSYPVFELLPLDAAGATPEEADPQPGMLVLRLGPAGRWHAQENILELGERRLRVRAVHVQPSAQLLEVLSPAEPRQ